MRFERTRGAVSPPRPAASPRGYLHTKEWQDLSVPFFCVKVSPPEAPAGFPAILKGFFDRVFLPGVSFRLVDGKVKPNLTNIRKIAAVTTYGGTRLKTCLAGDPLRRVVSRSIRYVCQAQKLRYLALHDMNCVTEGQRAAHLARVKVEMEAF